MTTTTLKGETMNDKMRKVALEVDTHCKGHKVTSGMVKDMVIIRFLEVARLEVSVDNVEEIHKIIDDLPCMF
jgi:hypothetical protein